MSGTSTHFDLMTAIKNLIDGESFAWLTGGTVITEQLSYQIDAGQSLPFISIFPHGQEISEDWTDSEDMTTYPTAIAIICKTSTDTLENRLGWREQLLRRFRNRGLTGVGSVGVYNFNNIPKPLNIVEPEAFKKDMFVSGIVVMSQCDTARLA